MNVDKIDEMVQGLADKWGDVYICVKESDYSLSDVTIRNVTDEGLPVSRDKKRCEGETLSEAIEKAYDKEVEE